MKSVENVDVCLTRLVKTVDKDDAEGWSFISAKKAFDLSLQSCSLADRESEVNMGHGSTACFTGEETPRKVVPLFSSYFQILTLSASKAKETVYSSGGAKNRSFCLVH